MTQTSELERGDTTTMVDAYFEMWNEVDPARRGALVERVWASDGRHVDPLLDARGHDALTQMVAGVQAQFPEHRLRRTSGVDAHHDQLRYGWELVAQDGAVVVSAIDVAEVDDDGRIRRVAAFFGPLPKGEGGR